MTEAQAHRVGIHIKSTTPITKLRFLALHLTESTHHHTRTHALHPHTPQNTVNFFPPKSLDQAQDNDATVSGR